MSYNPDIQNPQYLTLATSGAVGNERVFTPGTGLTGSDAGAGSTYTLNAKRSVLKRKAADTSRANTTTVSDDPDLLFAVGANETWDFTVVLFLTAGTATPDFKFTFAGPSGSTVTFSGHDPLSNTQIAETSGGSTVVIPIGNNNYYALLSGTCTNGATPGNLSIQWAQNASNANNTTLRAGSYLQGVE